MRNGWWTWWQPRENAIGCRKEGVNICPHLSLLISCCVSEGETETERSERTNGFRREAGLRCLVFLAHQSSPSWLIGGSFTPSSVPPTRESVTMTGSPLSVLVSAAVVYSGPAQNVWESVSSCLMYLFQLTLGKCVYMIPVHALRLWPCQSLLEATLDSMPIMFIVPTQLIGWHYIKHLQEVG